MRGKLEQIWEQERKVQIDGVIYNLANHIQIKFIKIGNISYSIDKTDNRFISFIKNENNDVVEKPKEKELIKLIPKTYEDKKQESIVNQFSIREGIKIIDIHNKYFDEKIEVNRKNIFINAQIVKQILEDLK